MLEGKRDGDDLQAKNISQCLPGDASSWLLSHSLSTVIHTFCPPRRHVSPHTYGPIFSECALMPSPCAQSSMHNQPYSIPQIHMGSSMPLSQQASLASKPSLGCRQRVPCLLRVIWQVWVDWAACGKEYGRLGSCFNLSRWSLCTV